MPCIEAEGAVSGAHGAVGALTPPTPVTAVTIDPLLAEMEEEHFAEATMVEELSKLKIPSRRRVLVRILELVTSGRLDLGLKDAPSAKTLVMQAAVDWKS